MFEVNDFVITTHPLGPALEGATQVAARQRAETFTIDSGSDFFFRDPFANPAERR